MSNTQEVIDKLKEKIKSYYTLREDMGEEAEHKIAQLEQELKILTLTTGSTVVAGNVLTGGGDFVGRDHITNIYQGMYHGIAPRNEEDALGIYFNTLVDRCSDLPLHGLTDHMSDVVKKQPHLSLPGVYIHLNTNLDVNQTKLTNTIRQGQLISLEDLSLEQRSEDTEKHKTDKLSIKISALQAIILLPRMVLLGDPGAGKTTFINFLGYSICAKKWDNLPDWPDSARNVVPVIISLRDFSSWLASKDEKSSSGVKTLWEYIKHDLEIRNLSFVAPHLESALQNGNALVLLDGLDEVSANKQDDITITSIIEAFSNRYKNSRYLITCRILSYNNPALQLPQNEFPTLTLATFTESQIEAFIHAWHNEIAMKWNQPQHALEKLEQKLQNEVEKRNDLKRLANNPLLLTVMALVHTSDGELPEARTLLYERAIDILLWRWDQQKGKINGEEALMISMLRQVGRDRNDLLVRLAKLAYTAHQQLHNGDDTEGLNGITEKDLLKELRELHPNNSWDWAEKVIEIMKLRTGLLVERTEGTFAFPHRTFQEYLAGVHLARQTNFSDKTLAHITNSDAWRIVALMAIGYLVNSNRDYEKPRLLIEMLCPPEVVEQTVDWQKVWLAGEALLEFGINRAQDTEHGKRILKRVRDRLTNLIEDGKLTPSERLEAGDILGLLDDPRFDKHNFHLPCLFHDEPENTFGFIKINSGAYTMGYKQENEPLYENEQPAHQVDVNEFYIARYPVINAQFHHFINDDGYNNKDYWTQEGWEWRNGKNFDLKKIKDKSLRNFYKDRLETRPPELRKSPYWWNTAPWNNPNRPVVGVCWYEAMAYCSWLDEQLKKQSMNCFPKGFKVRLPTEAEWEYAARGNAHRIWAWGNNWHDDFANIDKTGLKQTSPVGIFQKGNTPGTGIVELSGNVWEWMHTRWALSPNERIFTYPYNKNDGRENPAGWHLRALRGGSWRSSSNLARCAYRDWNFPDNFLGNGGFRCVVAMPFNEMTQ